MKTNRNKTLVVCGSALALALSSQATVSLNRIAVGSSTAFPTYSISGNNGSLSFTTATSTGGGSISGAVSQYGYGAGSAWGEVFNWQGSANGNTLAAFSMVMNGSTGNGSYQPFLMDLGTTVFNTSSSSFNPSLHANLLSSTSALNVSAVGSQNFLEFDLSDVDSVTLTIGHSYAFGLLCTAGASSDISFQRANGVQSDANGVQFYIASGGLTSSSATVPGWGGGPRNMLIGLYTVTVPEPSSMALAGLGAAAMLIMRRRKV
jgi:hypothetical protein